MKCCEQWAMSVVDWIDRDWHKFCKINWSQLYNTVKSRDSQQGHPSKTSPKSKSWSPGICPTLQGPKAYLETTGIWNKEKVGGEMGQKQQNSPPSQLQSFGLQIAKLVQGRWFIFNLNSMFYSSHQNSTPNFYSFDTDNGFRVGKQLWEISYLNSACHLVPLLKCSIYK